MQSLDSTDAVIEALGGVAAVAALTARGEGAVTNWKNWYRGRFPSETFITLQRALASKGFEAPARLWGIKDPDDAPALPEGAAA